MSLKWDMEEWHGRGYRRAVEKGLTFFCAENFRDDLRLADILKGKEVTFVLEGN